MGMIVGIDIGGSSIKIVGFTKERTLFGHHRESIQNSSSLDTALKHFLEQHHLSLSDLSRIVLTGVGASFIHQEIEHIPTVHISELQAIGQGGLILSGCSEALVVSMGTGTAFIHAKEDTFIHVGGTGVGGGTLYGLSSCLLGETDILRISSLAEKGNLLNVDLTLGDIFCGQELTLPSALTASNFGKMKKSASMPDKAAALLNLIFQTIGMLAIFALRQEPIKNIVLTGALTELPQASEIFKMMSELYHVSFMIPPHAPYATAIGAVSLAEGTHLLL